MGYYTEFKVSFRLSKETPEEIIVLLDKIVNDPEQLEFELTGKEMPSFRSVGEGPDLPIIHEFGKCPRWDMLFHSTNFDSENIKGSYFDKLTRTLSIHTEFKNYDDEIEKFLDWISPYILGRKKKQYLGFKKGETDCLQSNIYIER